MELKSLLYINSLFLLRNELDRNRYDMVWGRAVEMNFSMTTALIHFM